MRIRAIVFDYGHTLMDLASTEAILPPYKEQLAQLLSDHETGRPALLDVAEQVLRRVDEAIQVSFTTQRQIEELDLFTVVSSGLAGEGITIPQEVLARIVEIDHELHGVLSTVPEHIVTTLKELRARDYRLGVLSNTVFVRRWVHHLPLLDGDSPLDAVVLSSDIGLRKPHPITYQTVLEKLGVAPGEALFIGDRIVEDIRGPREFGFHGVFLTHEFRQEEDVLGESSACLSRLPELLDYLD